MYYIFESKLEANNKNELLNFIPKWVINKDSEKIEIFNCISCNSDVYSKCIIRNNYYCIICCLSNNCDTTCIQRKVSDQYKNIIYSNKDKYTKYMNIILFKIYEEYEYINKNKNKEIKEFIIDFINKFYPEENNKYYKKLLDYNLKSMHFICVKYYSLLYHKYTKLFNDIIYE
ncbi:unknown similar to AMEV013 [Mythimna separata entomopoxvirus 'L']|uniref:Uncharacterized protein n=1 Tax=Mythimna separata entomopoxvirus 'L' TaxID=1293572 RepID=A0A916KQH1_9POXV|nr:unknown similar to AMEV013 [Mythimna separata entomopoxvirus 'L']CCU56477.1 unknown similar to AMEV013 [Mythimna separata entomopoxvirus 'L']